ncbi:MAG: response regulator transcription factor [Candidatus Obscuribacterales bacterium]|nr:response regulator transcription factor [Candidatus Obscuribacterales bacterium]
MAGLLVVGNHGFIAKEISSWLSKEGYMFELCDSGESALRNLQKNEYDLALIDWSLPDMEGPELSRRIGESNQRMPIMMLGARKEVEDKIEALDSGALDYLVRPCSLPELSARLRSLLRRYGGQLAHITPIAPPVNAPIVPIVP